MSTFFDALAGLFTRPRLRPGFHRAGLVVDGVVGPPGVAYPVGDEEPGRAGGRYRRADGGVEGQRAPIPGPDRGAAAIDLDHRTRSRCEYASPQWFSYTGIGDCRELTARWHEILHADDAPRVDALWAETLEGGDSYDTEYRMRRRDGAHPLVQGPRRGDPPGRWPDLPLVRDLHRHR